MNTFKCAAKWSTLDEINFVKSLERKHSCRLPAGHLPWHMCSCGCYAGHDIPVNNVIVCE